MRDSLCFRICLCAPKAHIDSSLRCSRSMGLRFTTANPSTRIRFMCLPPKSFLGWRSQPRSRVLSQTRASRYAFAKTFVCVNGLYKRPTRVRSHRMEVEIHLQAAVQWSFPSTMTSRSQGRVPAVFLLLVRPPDSSHRVMRCLRHPRLSPIPHRVPRQRRRTTRCPRVAWVSPHRSQEAPFPRHTICMASPFRRHRLPRAACQPIPSTLPLRL